MTYVLEKRRNSPSQLDASASKYQLVFKRMQEFDFWRDLENCLSRRGSNTQFPSNYDIRTGQVLLGQNLGFQTLLETYRWDQKL